MKGALIVDIKFDETRIIYVKCFFMNMGHLEVLLVADGPTSLLNLLFKTLLNNSVESKRAHTWDPR